MTLDDIDALEQLEVTSTPAPWHVLELDDIAAMEAIAIATKPQSNQNGIMRDGTWPTNDVIAVCLLQDPPYAITKDQKYEENAKLIVSVRNNLMELLSLARRGLEASI